MHKYLIKFILQYLIVHIALLTVMGIYDLEYISWAEVVQSLYLFVIFIAGAGLYHFQLITNLRREEASRKGQS